MRLWSRVIICVVGLFYGCNHSNSTPEPTPQTTSIARLKSLYIGMPLTITDDITIRGRVVSTDQFGEWHKTLVITDATGGIELKLDAENLFAKYLWGALLDVHCSGLTLGLYGGVVQLGGQGEQYEVGYLSAAETDAHITFVEMPPEAPEYINITIEELAPRLISTYVFVHDVEFIAEELGKTLGTKNEYATRHLVNRSCDTLDVRIAPTAGFITAPIPRGSGNARGIISFFNGRYFLRLNMGLSDLFLDDDDRFE